MNPIRYSGQYNRLELTNKSLFGNLLEATRDDEAVPLSQLNTSISSAVTYLENNVYKVTYYEIITGASGSLSVPTQATINSYEFGGANCILSEIDGNNKPTWTSPKDSSNTVVTATLNTSTGAWVKSGVTTSANVALVYSVNILAKYYQNLNNFYIVEAISNGAGDLNQVLANSTYNSTPSLSLSKVISDETGSGALVFGTSPTFTTSIFSPIVYGSNSSGGTLLIDSTSHATKGIMTFGTAASSNTYRFNVSTSSQFIQIGAGVSPYDGYCAIFMGQGTPSTSNFTIRQLTTSVNLNAPAGGDLNFGTGGSAFGTVSGAGWVFNPPAASAAFIPFSFTVPNGTSKTASTNLPVFKVNGGTTQWATGTLATQYFTYLSANTISFVGASNVTSVYSLFIDKTTVGANATVTRGNWAAGFNGGIEVAGNIFITDSNGNGFTGYDVELNKTTAGGVISAITNNDSGVASYGRLQFKNSSGITYQITNYGGGFTTAGLLTAGSISILGTTANATNIIIGNGSSSKDIYFVNNGTVSANITYGIYGHQTSGAINSFVWSAGNNTGQTASAEISGYLFNSYSRQWATGAITTQREAYWKTVTYTAVGASTITNAYGMYVEAPTASTNVTITNNAAIGWANGTDIGQLGSIASGYSSIWLKTSGTPSTTNYNLTGDGATTFLNAVTTVSFRIGAALNFALSSNLLTFQASVNFAFDTSTGTKIGTATTQKIGFWNATPVVQPTATTTAPTAVVTTGSALASYGYTQAQADDIVTQLNRAIARLNDLATKLQTVGITA